MSNNEIPIDQLMLVVDAYKRLGTLVKVAEFIGMPYSNVQRRYEKAVRLGLTEEISKPKVPTGFEIKQITEQLNSAGEVTGKSVKMTHQSGKRFETPEGHRVKGVSAFVNADGDITHKWIKTTEGYRDPRETAKIIRESFEGFDKLAKPAKVTANPDNELMTVYPILDWHLGMFAWGKETDDLDWDLKIAKEKITSGFSELVHRSPNSEKAIFLGLGDILHADNSQNRTTRSGNALDVDTRYSKVLRTASDIMINCISMVADKHQKVSATFKRGNHDDESTVALRLAMSLFFSNQENIHIDDDVGGFYFEKFGVNLIGGTHGDKQKISNLPGVMANNKPIEWGSTSSRHFFTGHVHHEIVKEEGGVRLYSLRAPIPKDAYHAEVGYVSGKSLYAFHFHSSKGRRGMTEVEL